MKDVIKRIFAKSFISVLPLFTVSSVTLIKLLRSNIVLKLASIQFESLVMKSISVTFCPVFSEKYYFLEWPFEDFSVEPLCKLLARVYKETAFPVNFATQRMLKLLLVTNLYRIKFGHFMEVEKNSFNNQLLESFMQAEEIEEIVASFDSEYHISLNKEVIGQLFVSYFQKCSS